MSGQQGGRGQPEMPCRDSREGRKEQIVLLPPVPPPPLGWGCMPITRSHSLQFYLQQVSKPGGTKEGDSKDVGAGQEMGLDRGWPTRAVVSSGDSDGSS